MKKHLFILSSACLLLAACDRTTTTTTRDTTTTTERDVPNQRDRVPNANNRVPNADNTERNVRDRDNRALTSGNQSESDVDRTITQRIRQALMDDDALSTNAKNIKIITINGVVTLRGPVNSDRERSEIARKAQAVSGVRNVDNQLEIIRTDNAAARDRY